MRALTYCSFADDHGCRGVVVLEGALDPLQAARRAGELGINPGGELLAVPLHEDEPDVSAQTFEVLAANTHRLIPAAEARVLFKTRSIREHFEAN